MFVFMWVLLATSALPAPPAEVLPGTWWVKGNETFGSLVIQIDAAGKVHGTIYDQPIEGTFDPQTRRLAFTRFRPADRKGIQAWTGQLTHVAGSQPPTYTLQGTFQSIAGEEFGKAGVEYPWSSTEIRHPAPAIDLKELQGTWKVAHITKCLRKEVCFPDDSGLNQLASQIQIRDNQLLFQGQVVGTLANDLGLKSLEEAIGFRNHRPICLTTKDGKGFMCSYLISSEGVEIAYPHTTSCHRGSGAIIKLKRP